MRVNQLASLLAFLAIASVAPAADATAPAGDRATRSAIVTAVTSPLIIDGALDEPVWASAPKIGDLVQRQPLPGLPPTERTEVTLLYDTNFLYVGVTAYDSEPNRVIGTQMARDAALGSDDRIEILLDTFRDQRNAFYFATNPSGALVDGLAFTNEVNTNWDAIWQVRTRRTSDGWTAEFAIPFKSLGFPEDRSTWGFNIARNVYRKLEENRWTGARLATPFLQVSEAGEITNLQGLKQGIGLDVRPFVAGSWLHTRTPRNDQTKGRPGLDLFYNITPSLKLTGTINTDFGETEVDARQINLSRFSITLPEKRSFFLEDAGVFAFASTGPVPAGGISTTGADLYPFFSRQIGLLGGVEVPIDVGVKLTGKTGRTDLGLLGVRTRDTAFVEDKHFAVARVKQNLFEQSYIGAIFTNGHPSPGRNGFTAGVDTRLATSHFLGQRRNLLVDGYVLRSDNGGRTSDDDTSWGFSAKYPNDLYDAQIVIREIPRDFRPGLGFVQRSNVRLLRAALSYNPRPKSFLNIQQMFHDVYYTQFERLTTGQLESRNLYITPLDWHFQSGDSLHSVADPDINYERLFEPFVISPGVVLRPGEYKFTRFRTAIASATKRRLSGSLNLIWGEYWSGHADQVTTSMTYKLPPWFTLSLSANQTFARLPEGNFTARIYTATVNYAVSPRLSFTNLIQYDNRSRNLGWQSRMRWTPQAGRDLFLVFNQGWLQDPASSRFVVQDTKISTKFQYTFRF